MNSTNVHARGGPGTRGIERQGRRLFHKLRSLAMENFNQHLKGVFGVHGAVSTKGVRNTQRFALSAIVAHQVALPYRYERGLALNVGLKAILQAA